jgi:DNA polymerase-3 subunit delta'
MEGLRGILGQAQAVGVLRRALTSDRLAHAYLFEGPAGVGKATTARALMQALACERAPGEGCGTCEPCRKIDEGLHPDLVRVGLLEDKKDILIAQIRDVVRGCAYRPNEAPRRLVVLDPADRMNVSAANALLKTLEEPPEATHFVLVAEAPTRMPITIRSRCQRVRFAPLGAELVADQLARQHGVGAEQARFLAGLSDGSLGRAIELAGGEQAERRDAAERLHRTALGGGAAERFLATSEIGRDKDELGDVLALLRVLYRDALVVHEGVADVAPVVNADRMELVRELAADGGWLTLRRRLAAVAEAEGAREANVNAQLLLDRLLLRLRECQG